MADTPTAKQSLRRVIVGLFPWLPGVVAVAGAKGRGLAIRTASGLLHLAGGPDDPAVHRVNDLGSGGTFTTIGTALIYSGADGVTQWSITAVAGATPVTWTIVPSTGTAGAVVTKATEGSEKVTCA